MVCIEGKPAGVPYNGDVAGYDQQKRVLMGV